MDSPMTTPTSPTTTKISALELKHDALQDQVDVLTKQFAALNIDARVDVPVEKVEIVPPKEVKKNFTPAFALPWTGTPIPGCCQGIRSNYDTFTQCHQACVKDGIYCKTCTKNCGEDGIPKEGNVTTRPDITKKVKGYIHFMNAKKLSKADVIQEATKFGITLSDEIFEKPGVAKGRPKKVSATSDSDDEQPPAIQILGLLDTTTTSPKSP